jgi:hypothetical protein
MLVQWNSYDKQIYTFGKGPTAMTIAASPKSSIHGTNLVIEGFVTDISAGTKDTDRKARFPNGVSAVSDDSMSSWMEYVYMQQPCPTNVTGVPVSISVLDSNGNTRPIGSAISDGSGMFTFTWTPDIPGDYTVYASFAGSESYYPTAAETSFHVSELVTASPTATPVSNAATATDLMTYIAVAAIAIIIAVAVATVLILRKHP